MMQKLTFYGATEPNSVGVLVLPGGSYYGIALAHEGVPAAQWLAARGFDAWVLQYTVAAETPPPLYPAPLHDALRALRQIRASSRAPARLGVWGWSAGGHLAAITATDAGAALDFAVLAYPVISMEPGITHAQSRHNLLGPHPDPALQQAMCAESRVSAHTPPVFLFHTSNDPDVSVQNSLLFAAALARHRCNFQVHILPDGPHGLGMAFDDPLLTWTSVLARWLAQLIPGPCKAAPALIKPATSPSDLPADQR